MAIDIRASVTCSLGPLISATISDDYIQGVGLIKYRGNCEIKGVITPAPGTAVTFSYVKNGIVRTVPRKLRVLSSFADPFRRTTKVELGCKLTYLQDLREEPIKWPQGNWPFGISASEAMSYCLEKLAITAASDPLTNRFSQTRFDFGNGWVNTLSDLLVSESYCGYLDLNETLQLIDLSATSSTGPVYEQKDLIDVAPINVGQLPAEDVRVRYSYKASKYTDGEQFDYDAQTNEVNLPGRQSNWGRSNSSTSVETPFEYNAPDGSRQTAIYRGVEVTEEQSVYGTRGGKNVLLRREINVTKPASTVLGSYVNQSLELRGSFGDFSVSSRTVETYDYDSSGNENRRSAVTTQSLAFLAGSLNTTFFFDDGNGITSISLGGTYTDNAVETETIHSGGFRKVIERQFGTWARTIAGQQAVAESRSAFETASQVDGFIRRLSNYGHLLGQSVRAERTNVTAQEAPSEIDQRYGALADDRTNAAGGYTSEQTSESVLAFGSGDAQRYIEFNMPYASDDHLERLLGPGGTITTAAILYKTDAPAKGKQFGLVQNQMLLGNRNGMNIQIAPDRLPTAPFAPFVIRAGNIYAQYRLNGTSWTMDANGILVSTEALFWGAVGKAA
jgi:hypothetical protein